MRLYELRTLLVGKDLQRVLSLGFLLAESDGEVYDYLNTQEHSGGWPTDARMTREKIIAATGDFEADCDGEFYTQKFGWKDLGEVSEADAAVLKRLGLIKNG